MTAKTDEWDAHWLDMALLVAKKSKDPAKKVGAVIVGPDHIMLSAGFNGFPRGIADTPERLNDKELKRKLMVHGERNALLNAVRIGAPSLKGCVLYLAALDEYGPHGGCPCTACTLELIQAGISEIVSYPPKPKSSWADDIQFSQELAREAGIAYREFDLTCGVYGCERQDAHRHS